MSGIDPLIWLSATKQHVISQQVLHIQRQNMLFLSALQKKCFLISSIFITFPKTNNLTVVLCCSQTIVTEEWIFWGNKLNWITSWNDPFVSQSVVNTLTGTHWVSNSSWRGVIYGIYSVYHDMSLEGCIKGIYMANTKYKWSLAIYSSHQHETRFLSHSQIHT